MNGEVDHADRAMIFLTIRPFHNAEAVRLAVWVDTAFTGDLVVPRKVIEELGLRQSAAVTAGLADGTQVVLETYSCVVEWFGGPKTVEVVGNDGKIPLLGIGLLRDRRLEIDYRSRTVAIR